MLTIAPIVIRYAREEAERFNTTASDIIGQARFPHIVQARNALMRRLKDEGYSYQRIADALGRNRSTVYYAVHPEFAKGKRVRMRAHMRAKADERWAV